MEDYSHILNLAKEACENAYSPYSHFPVGACVLCEDGSTYKGCNVENASYGLSLCAERSAISSAIAHGAKKKITAVAIYAEKQKDCVPCGACRQWILEFKNGHEIKIVTQGENSQINVYTIDDLLPNGFSF